MAHEVKEPMLSGRAAGLRVLVTSADRYAGPPVVDLFRQEGAEVLADAGDYSDRMRHAASWRQQ